MTDVRSDFPVGRMVEHVSGAVGEVIVAGRGTAQGQPGMPIVFVDWIDGSGLSDAQLPDDLTLLPTYLELLRDVRRLSAAWTSLDDFKERWTKVVPPSWRADG